MKESGDIELNLYLAGKQMIEIAANRRVCVATVSNRIKRARARRGLSREDALTRHMASRHPQKTELTTSLAHLKLPEGCDLENVTRVEHNPATVKVVFYGGISFTFNYETGEVI